MFESQSINIIMTLVMVLGCLVSVEFAASVVAGAVGMFGASMYMFAKFGGPSHPVNKVLRGGRALFAPKI
ncbi:MAG TPA: hypothetical protein VEF76_03600 [Patescibacteria group bacterium]|nr:hypothetical protein [Patescibacteria group bacterium]